MDDRLEITAKLRSAVAPWMFVTGYLWGEDGRVTLRGRLAVPPEQAYRPLRAALAAIQFTPTLRVSDTNPNEHEIVAVLGVAPVAKSNAKINILLFLATVVSVTLSGSGDVDEAGNPIFLLGNGLMFAGSLLTILVAHEMGHYLVSRWRGAPASLPYFIPMPLALSGTMGAVIVQREPFEDRRTLLEVGIAGPIAGFVFAVPLFILGMLLSEVKAIPTTGVMFLGDSWLTQTIGQMIHGVIDPALGRDVFLHPIAMGAWIGLLITGINLIPAGQLDGGHVAYALFGERANYISYAMIGLLVVLSITASQGWLIWVFMLMAFGRAHPPVLNQATRLTWVHWLLAFVGLLIFVLTFVPRPIYS